MPKRARSPDRAVRLQQFTDAVERMLAHLEEAGRDDCLWVADVTVALRRQARHALGLEPREGETARSATGDHGCGGHCLAALCAALRGYLRGEQSVRALTLMDGEDGDELPPSSYWEFCHDRLIADPPGHPNAEAFGAVRPSDLAELLAAGGLLESGILDATIALLNVHARNANARLRLCDTNRQALVASDWSRYHVTGGPTMTGIGPGLCTAIPINHPTLTHWVLCVVCWPEDAAGRPRVWLADSLAGEGSIPPWLRMYLMDATTGRWTGTVLPLPCPRQRQDATESNACGMHVLQNDPPLLWGGDPLHKGGCRASEKKL